jgi:hypothetical protein
LVYRLVSLPAEVKADQSSATFEKGVLTMTVARAQHAQPTRIAVKTNIEHPLLVEAHTATTSGEQPVGRWQVSAREQAQVTIRAITQVPAGLLRATEADHCPPNDMVPRFPYSISGDLRSSTERL